ncbi:iron-sulfur cluster assembly scaffold protein [Paenibacillus humicola]|uniref:iron-sulfur cluster assembly scaffold protein n=1 Tax=Paenibacillus humicola TaxID=3110540 RepID=UPI00237AD2B1|nr:iron-sulfur cluster assembly scaffold protein [Paenibacillus humicola]
MYNPTIAEHFMNPRNIGELETSDETVRIGNPICGDTIHMQVLFDGDIAADVKYKAYGCAASIATASIFSEYVKGRSLTEIRQTPHFKTGHYYSQFGAERR